MKNHLLKILFVIYILNVSHVLIAQNTCGFNKYHRSSLYSILLRHPEKEFCNEMVDAFKAIPIPEKYNNHDLKIKVMDSPILEHLTKDAFQGTYKDAIADMLSRNKIAGRLVAKWFNQDSKTGAFNMDLIAQRGFYDASIFDINKAFASERGLALLADAGEELIGHTYVLVNDIRYVDKETSKAIASALLGLFTSVVGGPYLMAPTLKIASNVAGFKVYVTSYLFRLDWNEDVASNFYLNLWGDNDNMSSEKRELWKKEMGNFHLTYIGSAAVYSGKTSLNGVKYERDMFMKVCTRAIDKSISDLQKSFDEFKVFTPLVSTEPLTAYIGVKDGVEKDSRYEVLEVIEDENGRTRYKRVGVIRPISDKIWDNRYMANEEGIREAGFGYTTFEKVSGDNFYAGMLIREI